MALMQGDRTPTQPSGDHEGPPNHSSPPSPLQKHELNWTPTMGVQLSSCES